MSGMSSLSIAVSGMRAAQTGLSVTGHNLANLETPGHVRQQAMQKDFYYSKVGNNSSGAMKIGLGTDIAEIRQIRDKFLDISYREQLSKVAYYGVKFDAGQEIETFLGELEGEYKLGDILQDMRDAISELNANPTGVDTRGNFISTCIAFYNKVNNVSKRLGEYQQNINEQIKGSVITINNLVSKIDMLNKMISGAEAMGDNANDYRDERNVAIDQLGLLMDLTVKEQPNGSVDILCEGKELLVGGMQHKLGLRYSSPNCNFVEPVFTDFEGILPCDAIDDNAVPLYNTYSYNAVDAAHNNDKGKLKALLITRGLGPANYLSSPANLDTLDPFYSKNLFSIQNCFIPKVQMELDTLVHSMVTMINDTFSPYSEVPPQKDPNAPYGLDGTQYFEIFTRKNGIYRDRFDASGNYNEEDPADINSLYTIGNFEINPELLNTSGYKKIPTSMTISDVHDQTITRMLQDIWSRPLISLNGGEPLSVDLFYQQFVTHVGIETNEAMNYVKTQSELVQQIDGKRQQISGTSLDEEMKNMMVYQHAYNASARMINVLDGMIDKIVNGTGRVGM